MTMYDRGRRRNSASPICLRLALAAALVAGVGAFLSACNGTDSRSADVSIDTIQPEKPYPGVETTVEFSISPDDDISQDELSWRVEFGDNSSKTGEGTEGSVTHAWENGGQYNIRVTALAGDTDVGSATETFRVLEPTDLGIVSARSQKANVQAGEDVNVVLEVKNFSPTPFEQSVEVKALLTMESAVEMQQLPELPEVGTTTLSSEEGPLLGPGETTTATFKGTIPEGTEKGDYRLVGWLQPAGQFADSNPSNNHAVGESVVRIENESSFVPDVTVRDVYAVPDRAFPALNQLQRGFTMVNEGGVEAPGVVTQTYLSVGDDSLDRNEDIKLSQTDPRDLAPGEEVEVGPDQYTLDEDITPGEMGEKKVYIFVRAEITESDREQNTDNNLGVSDPPITVSDQLADGPDIDVESFSVQPQSTFLDGSLQATLRVANRGKADIERGFICGLYLGQESNVDRERDARFASINIGALPSGESEEVTRTVTIPGVHDPGTYHIYTYCDPNGIYDENFRSNNQKMHPEPVEVTRESDVDLFVDGLDVPETVQEGEETTITASVCVSGANASGETRGALYRTVGTTASFSGEPMQTFTIPNINPGECRDLDLTFEASCKDFEEEYAFGVEVDVDDTLEENDPDNNRRTGSNPMTVEGEFCSCTPDMYEPNENHGESVLLTPGDQKEYSLSICTPGSDDYFDFNLDKGDSIVVETTFDAEKGPLETTLFDPGGSKNATLDSDDSPGRQRVAAYAVEEGSRYTLAVSGAESSSRNLYDLDVRIFDRSEGIDLTPEPVTFPDKDSEATFSIGETVEATTTVHNIGTEASGNFDLQWVLTPDREVGDDDDESLSPAQVRVDSIESDLANNEAEVTTEVELPTNIGDGTYYVAARVDPSGSVTEANVDNNTNFSRAIEVQTRCYDSLEPNDDRSTATPVEDATYSNLLACASEDDFYELCVQDGRKFSVTTNFNPNQGDIDMELYDRNGSLIDTSDSSDAESEEVSVDYVNGDQCYYARVFVLTSQDRLETDYEMTVDTQEVDPSLQCASHFEPNNSFSSASSLLSAVQQSELLDRCPSSDEDFYRLSLSQGQKVSLRGILEPSDQPGSLRIQLFKPTEQLAASASTAPGIPTAEIEDYVAPISGTYFLQTTLSGSTRKVTYRLEEDGLGGIDLSAEDLSVWQGKFEPGSTARFDFKLGNQRSDTAQDVTYALYLSDHQNLDTGRDQRLQPGEIDYGDVSGNTTETVSNQVELPDDASGGKHYLHVKVESTDTQTDPNGANNVATSTIYFEN